MQNPPGLAALKLMHLLIAKAGGRMGEDVEHRVRLSEVRGVEPENPKRPLTAVLMAPPSEPPALQAAPRPRRWWPWARG